MNLLREKQRCRGHHRLHLGGDSHSSDDDAYNQYDQRATAGAAGALAVSGSNNVVTNSVTDLGAVTKGVELARVALAVGLQSAEASAAQTQKAFSGALDAVGSAYSTAKAGDQRIVSMVGLAVVGLAAITVIPAIFKKG